MSVRNVRWAIETAARVSSLAWTEFETLGKLSKASHMDVGFSPAAGRDSLVAKGSVKASWASISVGRGSCHS